ncbi:MAG: acyl-CoA synthetase [Cyclobacteriaceae bacterium]|nr:acyl-CoA synthetase [Cyclobacteriaceae bacterium]
MIGPLRQAREHAMSIAIRQGGNYWRYQDLSEAALHTAATLLNDKEDLYEQRVAFMTEPGFTYVSTLWGIWQAGGVAVPLSLSSPLPSLRYTLQDAACSILVVSPAFQSLLSDLASELRIRLISTDEILVTLEGTTFPKIGPERRALMLYTSGTTNLPKGVVSTHGNLTAQITTLLEAWRWSPNDQTLCVLPLHHVHGIVNVVCCSLWAGAVCEFVTGFDAEQLFDIFLRGEITVFMAVPTIYFKLIACWEQLPRTKQMEITRALTHFRLMVCGSAALPVTVMEKWKLISHHTLLERYGMTELGMAISNPYEGERRAGFVGIPLPGVSIRLADDKNQLIHDEPGEIQVKGDNVFLEYWNRPEATLHAFTADGWFKTGDVAMLEDGYYRILGRNSVDIIKSGGYKISALEIEEVLRTHPLIKDCAVVGLDNDEWGEIVAAAVVPVHEPPQHEEITHWLKTQLPAYRVPRKFIVVSELPRNAMGKVTKNEVKKLFQ